MYLCHLLWYHIFFVALILVQCQCSSIAQPAAQSPQRSQSNALLLLGHSFLFLCSHVFLECFAPGRGPVFVAPFVVPQSFVELILVQRQCSSNTRPLAFVENKTRSTLTTPRSSGCIMSESASMVVSPHKMTLVFFNRIILKRLIL